MNVTLEHFFSDEFKCPVCSEVKVSSELINKVEELFKYIHASKCIVSSGYRDREYDIKMNGFAGNGKIIDALEIK